MNQINIGGQDANIENETTYSLCILCDYDPPNAFEKKNDLCTCCDATDWFKKDA